MNKWKVEVRTSRYDGLGTSKVIRTDFYYSEQKPDVLHPLSNTGLIDVVLGDDRILVRACDVEFLHVAEINSASAAFAKMREDRISELTKENKELRERNSELLDLYRTYRDYYNPAAYGYSGGYGLGSRRY